MYNKVKHKQNNIWFWSDPHFFHRNIIRLSNRPFDSLESMHETLIKNYNSCVGPDDICIWVGDCFFASAAKAKPIMDRLNGKKIVVLGNHDKGVQGALNMGFDWACHEMWLVLAEKGVQIKHYPMLPNRWSLHSVPWWKKFTIKVESLFKYGDRRPVDKGQFLIHGHTHSKEKYNGRQIHVGVDAHNFKPVSMFTIENYIRDYK